jgi:L-ascorbate metabolism protein UlaG (beta-lactamase superfamily)
MKSKFPISDHCDGRHFFNPSGEKPKGFKDVIKWKLNHRKKRWPKWIENNVQSNPALTTTDNEVVLTFINHVTFLIQTAGLNILTDPVFSKRVSPSQLIGPQRIRAPGLAFDQLPKIDLVLLSHNHYDHMDLPTITKLAHAFQPQFVTPLGNGHFLKKAGAMNVVETDWWQTFEFQKMQVITVPAQHWSRRRLRDTNHALWSGFVLQTKKNKLYFAGDTGFGAHFKEIRQRLGIMDIALLPIGAYEPRWFMRDQHMNPEDAVLAHMDLEAKLSVGMHFGTFQLTDESYDAPVKELNLALNKHQISNFTVFEMGETRKMVDSHEE